MDLGVGLSPAIDSTIQFSELPNDEVLISGAAEGHWSSSSSAWPPVTVTTPSP